MDVNDILLLSIRFIICSQNWIRRPGHPQLILEPSASCKDAALQYSQDSSLYRKVPVLCLNLAYRTLANGW
jgi:hypothetical protein